MGLLNTQVRLKWYKEVQTKSQYPSVLFQSHFAVLLKYDLEVQLYTSEVYRSYKSNLSSTTNCEQKNSIHCCSFSYTLMCYLSTTWMFNNPTSEVCWNSKSDLSSTTKCKQNRSIYNHDFSQTLLCYLSPTWMFNKSTSCFH